MTDEDLIERMAKGIRDKSMTEDEARDYARGALAELRKGGYAIVKQEDIAELKGILLGVIGNIDAAAGKRRV